MEHSMSTKKNRQEKFTGKSPILFSIPLNEYSDEVEKNRDRDAFLKIQKLAKKCEQLRQSFHSYMQIHSERIEKTKWLVLRTIEVTNNFHERRIKD